MPPRFRLILALLLVSALAAVTGCSSHASHPNHRPIVHHGSLAEPSKKELAMELVSSAENSTLDWSRQYKYLEDLGDGRGYTGGIIGFTSATGDMLQVVQRYTELQPGNRLTKYLGALQKLCQNGGSDAHTGLDPTFAADWDAAAKDPMFQQAQNEIRDREYFNPAVSQAQEDGLGALGQFIYYDAMVMHGPGGEFNSFGGIRAATLRRAKSPAQGGGEAAYLGTFLDVRKNVMHVEVVKYHDDSRRDTSRIDTEQRTFLRERNFNLSPPLSWSTYGDSYHIP
jgi:chitosanase